MEAHADLFESVVALLRSLGDGIGAFPSDAPPANIESEERSGLLHQASPAVDWCQLLESYRPRAGAALFTSFRLRQQLYVAASRDSALLAAYDRLVRAVVLPFLKDRLASEGHVPGVGHAGREQQQQPPTTFYVQRPPSLRIQPPDAQAFCRAHRDAEYGHQVGEINFWMQLTDVVRTQTTLWVESAPGAGDFYPLEVPPGEIAAFHGTLVHHRVPPNASECTRVSLDFRIGVGHFFDPAWTLREAKAQHTRQEVTL